MTSKFWDESEAGRGKRFNFEFRENSLAGKAVIVAGGTGGLGAATVALLAKEGARLVVGFRRNRTRAEALAAAMQSHFGAGLVLVEGDLLEAGVRAAYLETAKATGAPLAGAAIFPGDPARASIESLDAEAIRSSLEINYVGPLLLARDLGPAMEKDSGGSLVLLATMQALGVFPGSVNYAAPKAALVHAAKILAAQWKNVRVNVVAPGATIAGMAEVSVSSGKYDAFVEKGAIPRFGQPEDVARAVRFFLEPDNYITGQVLAVDGGLTLRK
jgi:NAD(P)-dependent dehydrogenase (short-subunit alcohol dehydrogenase family)